MIFMKKILSILFLFFSITVFGQVENAVPSRPSPPKLVNDLTGKFLLPEQITALENKLDRYDDSTSNQIAVVIVDNLGGYNPDDYGNALIRKWGVGTAKYNNGVVILVSTGGTTGNRKAAISVGYGLEGAIPDLTARTIVDHEMITNFKAGNYYRGVDDAVDAIILAAAGRYKAPEGYGSRKGKGFPISTVIFIIILIVVFIGRNSGGKGGGGYMSRRGFSPWLWGGLGGFGSGGGWSGGGGSGGWSGGGGGGGFGGFGGGSSGGGGASGSW
jgi:uncharacterized protein